MADMLAQRPTPLNTNFQTYQEFIETRKLLQRKLLGKPLWHGSPKFCSSHLYSFPVDNSSTSATQFRTKKTGTQTSDIHHLLFSSHNSAAATVTIEVSNQSLAEQKTGQTCPLSRNLLSMTCKKIQLFPWQRRDSARSVGAVGKYSWTTDMFSHWISVLTEHGRPILVHERYCPTKKVVWLQWAMFCSVPEEPRAENCVTGRK